MKHTKKGIAACLVALAVATGVGGVAAQTAPAPAEQLAKDLREEIVRIPVTVKTCTAGKKPSRCP